MPLPIEPVLPALIAALTTSQFVVLEAPPGAGKTTLVPLALLNEPWLVPQRIVMLEPRRLAARAAAMRMAATLGERVGDRVGYRMRGETRTGPRTRIEVVTEGVLTRMLQHDLGLEGVGLVIFDEFHERSLIGDSGLALTLAVAQTLRPDLRVLVMSATLDGNAIATLLGGALVIRSEGRDWPVETRYSPPRAPAVGRFAHRGVEAHVAQVVRDVVAEETGSLLVFLPGAGEIRRVDEALRGSLPAGVDLHSLHGTMSIEAQDAAIAPSPAGRRKVVLATSIAETSLTIDGIRVVIDSGLMRVPRFSPRTGMTRLDTIRVSRASADQRRGRAGRLEPGVCIRCWSAADDAGLVPFTRPEILDADLAPLILDLASAGFRSPAELRWLDAPPPGAWAQGRELLQLLGALNPAGQLTAHGRLMAEAGTHPRLAHMLLRAGEMGTAASSTAAVLTALLEERDVLRGLDGPPTVDIQLRIDAVARRSDDVMLGGATVDRSALRRVQENVRARLRGTHVGEPAVADPGVLLAFAYPDRVAQRRGGPGRFLMRNGRGVSIAITDPLAHAEWIVALQIDDAGRDGRVMLAATIDVNELMGHAAEQVVVEDVIAWNPSTRSVRSRRITRLGALVLNDSALAAPAPAAVNAALLAGVRELGVGALPWSEAAQSLRRRLAFLHHHDGEWPDVGDTALASTLEEWLAPRMDHAHRFDDLVRIDFAAALRSLLTWEQGASVDVLAPQRITVPTGSAILVDYDTPTTPSLAVRLQEVFGMLETPAVLGGRVPVTMQLLSPGYRPVQVTRDLASFWRTGYFDVRRDLRGRYPKHHWPDDPLTAAPVRGRKK